MSVPYLSIKRHLLWLKEPNRSACIKLLDDNIELFSSTLGSVHNHQSWKGGYYDHICELLNICRVVYLKLNEQRRLPFTMEDALLVLFLHDLEKPWKYIKVGRKWVVRPELEDKKAQHEFRMAKIKEYGIKLTRIQLNALKYVEGELSDYSAYKRVANQLAGLCHACDFLSARLWYEHPKKKDDPWESCSRLKGSFEP